jgi:CheY-like chemotaxis protein
MQTLFEDGVAKAAQGLTTLEELLRLVAHSESRETVPGVGPANEPAPEVVADKTVEGTERQGGRRRVLVVEDNATIVSVVKYFLELEGFTVSVAEDGLAGLEMAFQERPDMIVSDLNMPGMDGLAMIRALRKDQRTSDVRVLMLTSETSVESETLGLAAGADDYILKPVEPRRLAARVKSLLGRTPRAA